VKHQEGDFWRWEIIKTIARHRDGRLTTDTAQKAICNAAKYMPDMYLVNEFQSKHGWNNE